MNHFDYRDGVLHAEDVSLMDMAASVGTPFYCYSTATLERHYKVFAEPFADVGATICYALKANANIAVVRTFADLGAGADVVSGGELRQARAAGVPAARIVFSGVGKTAGEIAPFDGFVELIHAHRLAVATGGEQGRLVDQIGQIGSDESTGDRGE